MIEKQIPKEIKEYKEKILCGLTVRQLIATIITLGICIPTYIFTADYLGDEMSSWICILVGLPTIAIGFFKKNGMNFESYMCAVFKSSVLSIPQRKYKSQNFFEELEKEDRTAQNRNKKKTKKG